LEHAPLVGSQLPAVWQASLAVQVTAVPAHVPPAHESPVVQGLPSLQLVPSGAVAVEQVPVDGLQVPGTWHWPLAVQTTGLLPVHVPPAHA
jgi:hypothetical protein